MTDPEPRAYTPEEVRNCLLEYIQFMVRYWEKEPRTPDVHGKLSGLAHSILVALDGCAPGLPAFLVTPTPHESDREFHRENGENWFPEDKPDLGMLHDHFYKWEKP